MSGPEFGGLRFHSEGATTSCPFRSSSAGRYESCCVQDAFRVATMSQSEAAQDLRMPFGRRPMIPDLRPRFSLSCVRSSRDEDPTGSLTETVRQIGLLLRSIRTLRTFDPVSKGTS